MQQQQDSRHTWRRVRMMVAMVSVIGIAALMLVSCSSQKNTARSRWWHAFNARYNTYYNGSQAFIEGSQEREKNPNDNFTEMLPLYTVANKKGKDTGKSNFDKAIEKSQKAIKQHTIKRRPEWNKSRRKTAKDIEWLNRREYNPFLWKAWLLMGKSQFQKGNFEEAAATFSYMSRLYATQPSINGISRAWLAKSYVELDWLYDAEDVINKMKRDSMHYNAVADWDYAYADYYLRNHQYKEAVDYMKKVVKHEKRRKQKAREWFILGQLYTQLGNNDEAYKAYRKVIRLNPPYQVEFNARISQTEVMAKGNAKGMIRKLKRMASSDKNSDYLDQVYYALGNIYLMQNDTTNAIAAYEKGNAKATRSGIEKGVLLLKLGDLYWQMEKYSDAKRCYGEAIGLLDKDRKDYEQLAKRSKDLDELVPFTEAIHLQDSLLALSVMPEKERNAAIDRVIDALKKKEKEERRAQQEAEAERQQSQNGGNRNAARPNATAPAANNKTNATWYFYNPMAVSQGKTEFQRLWGKRENVDNWQRINKTVVNLGNDTDGNDAGGEKAEPDSIAADGGAAVADADTTATDTTALDPHKREYYIAQIPFTDEQKKACHDIISDGLFNSGVIFKDKLENLPLSDKQFSRLLADYPEFEKTDEVLYHLFLLYSLRGDKERAQLFVDKLAANYPESQWTTLLCNPYYEENARFGTHIEDSLYAATYNAFKEHDYAVVAANAAVSEQRFPLGEHRDKFLFVHGLCKLNEGDGAACIENMKAVVEKYPQSEVAEMAGMIVKGVQTGRTLHGGTFDLDDVWSRRGVALMGTDSLQQDTLSDERNANFLFILAFRTDSIDSNQLLFELARYNFTNFLVRNFEITTDQDNGISRMMVSGFLNYDEALQYARQLYADSDMSDKLRGLRRLIISETNLKLLGLTISYQEYQEFFDKVFAPMQVTTEQLLDNPETIQQPDEEDEGDKQEESESPDDDLFNNNVNGNTNTGGYDFDEDFYR